MHIYIFSVGFPFLAQPIFEYIVSQNAESCLVFCETKIIPNTDAREVIEEISKTNEEEFRFLSNRPDVLDYIFNAGMYI